MWFKRQKYVPKLTDFLSLCERNYAQLNRYLAFGADAGQTCVITFSKQQSYQLTVTEVAKFTTTLRIVLMQDFPNFLKPNLLVRLYHDAQVAEVLECQDMRSIKPRYDYPNVDMLQPDEKRQINLLLRDWLKLCASNGYSNKELVFV